MPFDRTGISTRVLRSDPVGVVLRVDDPLAQRGTLVITPGRKHSLSFRSLTCSPAGWSSPGTDPTPTR
jgi:hypothetical protein